MPSLRKRPRIRGKKSPTLEISGGCRIHMLSRDLITSAIRQIFECGRMWINLNNTRRTKAYVHLLLINSNEPQIRASRLRNCFTCGSDHGTKCRGLFACLKEGFLSTRGGLRTAIQGEVRLLRIPNCFSRMQVRYKLDIPVVGYSWPIP